MAEPGPKLVSVGGESVEGSSGAQAPEATEPRSRRVLWLVAALLLVALTALVGQTRRVSALSGQVESLTGELASARAALVAYQDHLQEVRASVTDLQGRMAELDTLVRRDPGAPPPPPQP